MGNRQGVLKPQRGPLSASVSRDPPLCMKATPSAVTCMVLRSLAEQILTAEQTLHQGRPYTDCGLLVHDRSWDIPQMIHGLRRAKLITAVSKPPVVAMAGQFIRAVAILAILLSLSAPVWAGIDEGVAALERGDYATALQEFRPLAEQGDAGAQINLGVMYEDGRGVPQDHAEAVKWFKMAAAQGNAEAQHNLGFMYGHGEGVPQDYAEAVKWFRKAANQGVARAQYNLGVMYDNGDGVPQDYAEAVKWYREAAEQDLALAQVHLGRMYYNGRGVPQDLVRAHMWFNLNASSLPVGPNQHQAVKNRDLVAKLMIPAQIAEAERLAREWTAKHNR